MKYYSKETQKALQNFSLPLPPVSLDLIYAIAEIKKAACKANKKAGKLTPDITQAIETAAMEVVNGNHDSQFATCSLQGGAGTSINMNVNEVIAQRATEILRSMVHPNDHVNLSQSTNDVNPSALRITGIRLTKKLLLALDDLTEAFALQGRKYQTVRKLGRTHMQDAVPITLGQELNAYCHILIRDKKRIIEAEEFLHELNLGGTAVGNSINASKEYIDQVYNYINKDTRLNLKPAPNFMSLTESATDFLHLISALNALTLDLSKIASDLRILSSGPRGGVGEISLAPIQAGSSIMPGKINPVIPECINQIHYFVSGKHQTIQQAVEASFLELANMFPVIADSLITSLKLVASGMQLFSDKCIKTIKVNRERCEELLEKSTAYATLLTPKLGYDKTAEIVQEALNKNVTIRKIVLDKKLITEQEFDELVNKF